MEKTTNHKKDSLDRQTIVNTQTQVEYMHEREFDDEMEAVERVREYAVFEAMNIMKQLRNEGVLEE